MSGKNEDADKDLSAAAVDSVKEAVGRARVRKAKFFNRRGLGDNSDQGKINVVVRPRTALSYDNTAVLPYHQQRRVGLLTGPDDSENEDSNDEWEEHVDVDEGTAHAWVTAAKAAAEAAAAARRANEGEIEKGTERSSSKTGSTDVPLTKEQREEAEIKRKRAEAAKRRSRIVRQYQVHILMLVALLDRMDTAANDEELQALALSIVPEDVVIRGQKGSVECLSRFALWFRMAYRCVTMFRPSRPKRPCSAVERAKKCLTRQCGHVLDLGVVAAAILRAEGERCRIVVPLQPFLEQVLKPLKNVDGVHRQTAAKSANFFDGGFYSWLEVWSETEDKWVPIDFFVGLVDASSTKDVLSSMQAHARDILTQTPAYLKDDAIRDRSRSARTRLEEQWQSVKRIDESCLAHVVAAEDGFLTDVTRRYVRSWKIVEKRRGKGRVLERIINELSRHLQDDEQDPAMTKEQELFDALSAKDAIPTSVAACHNHPRYILERHLKKYEILYPRNPVVGYIKKEPIFFRSRVKILHTKDRWIRKMRQVKPNAKPMKHVKSAVSRDPEYTIPLFGEWQTTPLVIEECKNGKVPRNERGNVDLWTEEHLPKGAVHVNLRFAAVAARALAFDYAPAMTGFELRKGRSTPRIEGIVIAKENASAVIDAAREKEAVAFERAEANAREDAHKRWLSLLKAMAAREKVQNKYMLGEKGERARDGKMQVIEKGTQKKRASPDRSADISPEASPSSAPPVYKSRKTEPHVHSYVNSRKLNDGEWVKTCRDCGMKVYFEKL